MATNNLDFIVKNGLVVNNTATILETTNSNSTNSGAFQVVGGAGIGGNLYVGGTIYGTFSGNISGSATTATNSDNIKTIQRNTNAAHYLTFVDSDNSTAAYEALYTDAGISYNPSTNDLTISGKALVNSNTSSTSTTTGALQVVGGVGIGGNLYVGGEIVAEKLTIQFTTVTTTLIQTDDVIQTLNTTNATSTSTGALKVSGGAGIGGNIHVGGSITSNDNVYSSNSAAVSTTSTTAIDTFDKNVYRLSKYIIQVTQSTNYQASEILILHNDSDSFITEYAVVRSDSNLANFSTDISGNNVRLLVNMISATAATIKMNRISILV